MFGCEPRHCLLYHCRYDHPDDSLNSTWRYYHRRNMSEISCIAVCTSGGDHDPYVIPQEHFSIS